MKPFKTYLRLYIAIAAMLTISAPVYSQPNIQHSIYFKEQFCPEPYYLHKSFYLQHSKGSRFVTYHALMNGYPYRTQVFAKLTNNFDTVFTVNFKGNQDNIAEKILELPNGNILIAGHTESDDNGVVYGFSYKSREIWLLEVDTMGNFVKAKTIGGGNGSELTDASISSDGYILLAGNTIADDYDFAHTPNGAWDAVWIAKYDTTFNKVWIKVYDNNEEDGWPTIKEVMPHRYIVGFGSNGTDAPVVPQESKGKYDLIVYYMDSSANILWKHRYGTPEHDGTRLSVVDPDTKDVYFINDATFPGGDITHHSGSCWIHKVDTFGNTKGSKAYGASVNFTRVESAIWYEHYLWLTAYSQGGGGYGQQYRWSEYNQRLGSTH